jgi:CRP/FNR family nitrogen fixation transcriptional regulator
MSTELAIQSLSAISSPAMPACWTKSGDDEAAGLQPAGSQVHFTQGRAIYCEGDTARFFFKVVSGVVRTCKFLTDGRRQIDAFYVSGEIFGFEFSTEHAFSAEAVCDCAVVPYRRYDIASPKAQIIPPQLFSHAMRSVAQAREHSLLLGRKNAFEKVAAFLLDWMDDPATDHVVNLAMTRQDMADYLGLTLETVSRTLAQLERDKLIEIQAARQIRIRNIARLRHLNA